MSRGSAAWEFDRRNIILLFYASRGVPVGDISELLLEHCDVSLSKENLERQIYTLHAREKEAGYASLYKCRRGTGAKKHWDIRAVDDFIYRKVWLYEFSEWMMIGFITLERGARPLLGSVRSKPP